MKGDLDRIVTKSLEKDRGWRYDTASAFAADVPPVSRRGADRCPAAVNVVSLPQAGPPEQGGSDDGSAVAVALLLGTLASTWQAVRSTRAETVAQLSSKAAQLSEVAAEDRKREADDAKDKAEKRRDELAAVNEKLRRSNYITLNWCRSRAAAIDYSTAALRFRRASRIQNQPVRPSAWRRSVWVQNQPMRPPAQPRSVGVQNQPMRPPALELREMAGILQYFAGSLPATKGLIAAPWTLLVASLCFRLRNRIREPEASGPLTTLATAVELYPEPHHMSSWLVSKSAHGWPALTYPVIPCS